MKRKLGTHTAAATAADNPYSESLFKTLKYGPEFPERFGSLGESGQFMDTFTHWYNHEQRRHTPTTGCEFR